MRAYTVATVAVTLNVTPKLIDNILSHHRVRGVSQSRQGIARRLTPEAVTVLEIALRLTRSLSLPATRALELASALFAAGGSEARHMLDAGVHLTVDISSVEHEISIRLAEAVESAPTPKRGRPRRKPA